MNKINTETLRSRFPVLYSANRFPYGFECGDGWFTIINTLSETLQTQCALLRAAGAAEHDLPTVLQVKEKFGMLCYYLSNGNDVIYAATRAAEMESSLVCEKCGKTGELRTRDGWASTHCYYCADTHRRSASGARVSKLMQAAWRNDTIAIKTLLAAGRNVNAKTVFGHTALGYAAAAGHLECLCEILAAGADVNVKDKSGRTALTEATVYGHTECVKTLIDAGADINAKQNDGSTALMIATLYGQLTCVTALIDAGADVNVQDKAGWTALAVAASGGHTGCVNALVAAGASVNIKVFNETTTALIVAGEHGHMECVQALIEAGADIGARNAYGQSALMVAAGNGKIQCLRVLIRAGANVNARNTKGRTALMGASRRGDDQCLRALIEAHADVNAADSCGVTALREAAEHDSMACVKILAEAGADFDYLTADYPDAVAVCRSVAERKALHDMTAAQRLPDDNAGGI